MSPVHAQITHEGFSGWLELDGIDDYAMIADNATLDIGNGATDDFTIECFFYYPDTNITGTRTLIFKNTSYGLYLLLYTTQMDRIIFRMNFSPVGTDYYYTVNYLNFTAGWHHIAASYDNEYTADWDAMQVFLDGTRIFHANNFEITPGIYNSTGTFYAGSGNALNMFYQKIDEMRVSDIIRYPGTTYTVPSSPFTNDGNTRALWHFDETAGSTSFADASGNNNTLAGQNGGQALPVQLESFTATCNATNVDLRWTTATEMNNYGFEVERKAIHPVDHKLHNGNWAVASPGDDWARTGFVEGHGTTDTRNKYFFTDRNLQYGWYGYRLKQLDRDGKYFYSQEIEVGILTVPKEFTLLQNYPNPFNPSTVISYQLPVNSFVTLTVYDLLGREVALLVNEMKDAGSYSVQFSMSDYHLPSGIYFYRMQTEHYSEMKRMLLLK